jgi:diguanylate cyclase (GGDEF)-like protein
LSRPKPPTNQASPRDGDSPETLIGPGATVLVVAAEERAAEVLVRLLRALGWSPVRAESTESALHACETFLPALAVIRFDESVLPLIEGLRSFWPLLPLIAVLEKASPESTAAAYEAGASVCLPGPPTESTLRDGMRRATLQARRVSVQRAESIRLVESSRAIGASLLFSDIYPLTLDTLIHETGSQAAVGIFAHPDRAGLGLRALRGIPDEDARRVAQIMVPLLDGRLAARVAPLDESSDPALTEAVIGALKEWPGGAPRVLFVPIPRPSRPNADPAAARNAGGVLLLRPQSSPPFGSEVRDRAAFLAAQAGIAFQNGALYAAAEERAYLDPLTGLYNTRYLYATLEQEISRSDRYGHELSVLFLDLDRFKEVNDRHNHLVGSAVLVETAHLIDRKIRQVDSAVRYGGDEFTVILVETPHAGALHVAERIRSTVAGHVFQEADGLSIHLTCSIGVSTFPLHGTQPRALIEAADLAMYRAKAQRDRVCSAS